MMTGLVYYIVADETISRFVIPLEKTSPSGCLIISLMFVHIYLHSMDGAPLIVSGVCDQRHPM